MTRHGIFTENEFRARHEIHLEAYCKLVRIEAQTALDMAMRQILPAVSRYTGDLCRRVELKQKLYIGRNAEMALIHQLSEGTDALYDACSKLKEDLAGIAGTGEDGARYYQQVICADMAAMRKIADDLEVITDKSYWPFPTYSDILFY